jgi:hypothetical protein
LCSRIVPGPHPMSRMRSAGFGRTYSRTRTRLRFGPPTTSEKNS